MSDYYEHIGEQKASGEFQLSVHLKIILKKIFRQI
jgi:hypothetical protein